MTLFKLVIWAQLFGSGIASADLLYLNSHAGLATSAGVTAVTISPHPAWEPNHPANPGDPNNNGAVWISYADTGYGGSTFQPYSGSTPVVTIYDTFQSDPGTLHLDVWADDTADVLLDGEYLYHAVFTQSTCSGQPIGCLPDDAGVINTPLSAGNHTLAFVLYQVGTGTNTWSNPFGLLFSGTAPADPPITNPEPSSILLLGATIVAAFAARWKRRTAR
jgi:hypothetical protein